MAKHYFQFGYILRDIEQETEQFVDCDTINEMFTEISRIYCFADCDNTFQIVKIIAWGKEVEYVGWQPDMYFEYRFIGNNEIAWDGCFPHWEH